MDYDVCGTVICGDSWEEVEETLDRWRYALKRREMKVRQVEK